jgi:glycosyltransferase involved in cell wall biosynthesis
MKIIYFSQDYGPHDHRFLSALSETEHQVYYVRLERGPRQIEDRPVPENIEQVLWAGGQKPFEWRDLPKLTFDFRRLTRALKPDLVHAGPVQTCAFIAVLSGFRPILTMSWGFDLMQDVHRSRWWEFATHHTLKRSTFFTSDALVTRDKAVVYGMNPDRTLVFPWGVDLDHFAPPTTNPSTPSAGRRRQSSTGLTLLCNRSWEPRYGVDILAKAFVKVAQQREDVGLILLNGGSQAQVIRQILMGGGVLDRVHFGGQVSQSDMPNWYHMADLYISPSHIDGSSVSLMEALACGLPVLVSDIPANLEWVTDGQNGWVFPDGDVQSLTDGILMVADRRESLPEIGRAARRSAQERADWNKNVRKLFTAYEQVLKFQ